MGDLIERDWVLKRMVFEPDYEVVQMAPAVEAEPVRHGRWEIVIVSTSNPYESEIEEKCSICGRCVQRYGAQPQDNYCPNCGAKMDGGDDSAKNKTD